MKKTDKELEQKLEQELEQYLNNIEVPDLNIEKQQELRKLVEQNKQKSKRITLWRRITAVASAVCLIALMIIPTVFLLNKNENPPSQPPSPPTNNTPIYYGKAEATKTPHSLQETQEIISTKFPKYNFIFSDLVFYEATGFYNPENNSLLALKILLDETTAPFTRVEIHLIASEQFIFDNKILYTEHANYTKTNEYEMYKLVYQDDFTEYERGYIIFEDHEIYVNLDKINDVLFNKFI